MEDARAGKQRDPTACDVVIVGGGIAGLYAAYRLRQAWESAREHDRMAGEFGIVEGEALKVVILEENATGLGGRLRSVELPFPGAEGGGSVIAEVGAMRFTTRQQLVRRLLHDLGVRTVPFEGDGFSTRYFLRGKHFGASDIERGDAATFPYHVDETEKGKGPTELLSHVLERTLQELSLDEHATPDTLLVLEKLRGKASRDRLTHREWAELQKHGLLTGKVRLENIGMWNLLHHYLSPDAAHFVEDGFGYESIIGNWNVSDAIPWFIGDFSPGQVYETVDKSFSHVVERIKAQLESQPDVDATVTGPSLPYTKRAFECRIVLNSHVRSLTELVDGENRGYELKGTKACPEYRDSSKHPTKFPAKWTAEGEPTEGYRAKAVILALPKEPLRNLHIGWLDDALDTSEKQKDRIGEKQPASKTKDEKRKWLGHLAKVRAHRLAKIVLAYRNAWWRTKDLSKGAGGRTFTDLPLRQVYYFDREWLEARGRYKYYDNKGREVDSKGRLTGASKDEAVKAQAKLAGDTAAASDETRNPEIEGMVIAYLDGHYASFWSFITAVQRIHDSDEDDTPRNPNKARQLETYKRRWFGKRVWGWIEPQDVQKLYETPDKDWTAKERGLHLYFTKYGLYERAATKMTHILRHLHAASANDRGERMAVPEPVAGAYNFWDDFGDHAVPEAGWHTWEPGVESAKAMTHMVQPFGKERRVFVCGEAYSSEQGWIEGALKSVELVMDRLGVLLPDEVANPDFDPELKTNSEGIRDYVGLRPRRLSNAEPPTGTQEPTPISDSRSIVFLSGMIGFDGPPDPVPTSIEQQTAGALECLFKKLRAAKGQPQDIVSLRIFLRSMDDYERFNQAYSKSLTKWKISVAPASTTVAVKALRSLALIEIEAVAVIRTDDTTGKKLASKQSSRSSGPRPSRGKTKGFRKG